MSVASVAAVASLASPSLARAQLDLPLPSPEAKVSQRVGLTDVSVEYSSPGVKSRKIWGELVPFDKLWRAGANAATRLTLGRDAQVCGHSVAQGTYALFFLPSKKDWTLVLNRKADQPGMGSEYDAALDAVRCPVKTSAIPFRERLIYVFSNTADESTSLDLEWEKLRVAIPITVETQKQALANIQNATEKTWRVYANAARYLLEKTKDYDAGLKYVDQSLSLKEDWYNDWIKASLLAAKGNYKDAYAYAEKSNELGKKSAAFFLQPDVKKALEDWKKRL